jgi:GNAT superfamily N-acetyltransferase
MAGLMPPRPLAEADDRQEFDCGRPSLTQWFRRHAWRCQQANAARTSVLRTGPGRAVVGYVTLCAAQVERAHLPNGDDRARPGPLPALLLWQLAVDARSQGQGHARTLMLFALMTSLRAARQMRGFAVLAHPLDDGMRSFFEKFGFAPLPADPRGGLAVRIADLERAGLAEAEGARMFR